MRKSEQSSWWYPINGYNCHKAQVYFQSVWPYVKNTKHYDGHHQRNKPWTTRINQNLNNACISRDQDHSTAYIIAYIGPIWLGGLGASNIGWYLTITAGISWFHSFRPDQSERPGIRTENFQRGFPFRPSPIPKCFGRNWLEQHGIDNYDQNMTHWNWQVWSKDDSLNQSIDQMGPNMDKTW